MGDFIKYTLELEAPLRIRCEVLAIACFALVVCIVKYYRRKPVKNVPPGPKGLPIVGYLPFLSRKVHLDFTKLGKKYGDVFSVRLGSQALVILNSEKVIREAFVKPEFLERPEMSAFNLLGYKSAFFMNDINLWHDHRKMIIQSLKEVGCGKSKLEFQITEEINHLMEILKIRNGEPVDIKNLLQTSVIHNMFALLFGSRYAFDHAEKKKIRNALEGAIDLVGIMAFRMFFPWLQHIPYIFKLLGHERNINAFRDGIQMYKKKVVEHKKTFDSSHIRDFIDSCLERTSCKKEKNGNSNFTTDHLTGTVADMFGAGSETVITTISWYLYTMAAYPDIQRKVQKEILDVLGSDRCPEFLDQKMMPYTHATILEILRWKTPVPINTFRCTTADTTVGGYDIPKGTVVTSNIWAVHHDPDAWKDPERFRPERFLGTDGQVVPKSLHFMPFSIGKRICPGETMAQVTVFLNIVSILQKYDVCFPEGFKANFDGDVSITYRPKPFKVLLRPKT